MTVIGARENGQRGHPAMPVPTRERWQPLRAGLIDLFLYDYEEFRFRDGHLLLRGNNGTGKSKVLALMLPFLLDGDLSPHRVEPDGDPAKRMEWNLLLGGRYEERLGYTWLELGRLAEDGSPLCLTIGCGLKAVQGRGVAQRWLFVTTQRVGVDLWLVSPAGTALTRDRLIDAIGARGQVYDQAEAYRRAVDEQLFHLGPDRYDALVSLLIQLRQPQLSKRPNEERLSAALSEALTPLDQAVLSDVAEAFHDLEQQREELSGLQETRRHVDRFLERYRHYARIAARRQARVLRSAQADYETTNRQLGAVREQLQAAQAAEGQARERRDRLDGELRAARAAERELRESPEIKDLDRAEELAGVARGSAGGAAGRLAEAEGFLEAREEGHRQAARAAGESRSSVVADLGRAGEAASAAHVTRDHEALLAPLALPDGPAGPEGTRVGEEALRAAASAASAVADRRRAAAEHLRDLVDEALATVAALAAARGQLDRLEGERDGAAERRSAAEEAVATSAGALAEAWRDYARSTTELRLPDPDELLPGLLDWAGTLAGDNPAGPLLAAAGSAARNALAERRARALSTLEEAQRALGELVDERQRLLRGEHERPPAPYTRAPGVRDGRAGAPLWQVIDFREDVGPADQAGLEAALEASGLLDAWVTPNGRLLEPGSHDVVVTAGTAVWPNLGALLRPAIDRDDPQAGLVGEMTVQAVLEGIGLGAGSADTWVDPSGRWRLGVAEGAWAKRAARFVGRGAREAARRQRLAELAAEIQRAETAVSAAEATRDAVVARHRTLEAELGRAPSDQPVRDAHATLTVTSRELERKEEAVAGQWAAVAAAEERARDAVAARDQAAADLGLPADRPALTAVLDAVLDYQKATASLWPAARLHADRLRALLESRGEVAAARRQVDRRAEESKAAEREAAEAEARLETVRAAIGATVGELRARLQTMRDHIERLDGEHTRLGEALDRPDGLVMQVGRARGREEELLTSLDVNAGRRAGATAAFQRFARTGLLLAALPELELPAPDAPWAPDPAVRLARRVEQALAETDAEDHAWSRVLKEITTRFGELQESLSRHGHQAAADLSEERLVVSIVYQGQSRDPGDLVRLLGDEIDHRERLLSAKERELLEEHLVNEVASHLQELIGDAEAQVQRINEELVERPTSTGVKLRFRWEVRRDGPPGLAEARRRLLRQAADAWSPEDRIAVSAFLQQQIAAERARDDSGTWLEHLAAALDYRAWHRFTIERWQDGRWRSATGPASSGERVLTVTLPLFAAASAHYRSAQPAAPRLVLLDEAFAGVDDDARAKCMGLLATFDLDFVMTSEREWGCYPTVPGLAIHQLTRREGIDAVYVTCWEWDGRARTLVEPQRPPLRPPSTSTDGNSAAEADGAAPPAPGGQPLWSP
jgi:uncharacterized protein (TIGR02680 family)